MEEKRNQQRKKDEKRALQAPRGMHDVLPAEQPWWERVRRAAQSLAAFYSFARIDTPILESARLFEKGSGEGTDLVQKEMYTLKTKSGDYLALRPELTPSLMRSWSQHGMSRMGQPQKFFLEGPVFRHDAPQAGRYRQFTQIEFNIIGGQSDPIYDAQIILMFHRLLEELKIKNVTLKTNSIGCKVCRPLYKRQLQNYYKRHEKKLCADCVDRLRTNPLRLLDCKNPSCGEFKEKAPVILDKLCSACSAHFKGVLEYLEEVGISYFLDNQLVRGLDYYSRTVFEFFVEGPGSEVGALPGGGRFDYLLELLDGKATPAVGGAVSIERLIYVMKAQGMTVPGKAVKKIFFVHVGDLAKKKSLKLIEELRRAGISVAESLGRESLKAQLRLADREGIELALLFGQKEVFDGNIIIRNLKTSLQETVPLSTIVEEIKKRSRATFR